VPLEGVTKPLVSVEFNAYGFDLRVTGLAGANYRCAVSDLHAEIVPGESSFMVPKSNKRVVVKLKVPTSESKIVARASPCQSAPPQPRVPSRRNLG